MDKVGRYVTQHKISCQLPAKKSISVVLINHNNEVNFPLEQINTILSLKHYSAFVLLNVACKDLQVIIISRHGNRTSMRSMQDKRSITVHRVL